MIDLSRILKGAQNTITKHSPEILTGIGIAGMITASVLAVKATPKALELMEEKRNDLDVDALKPVEVVKTTWKCYIPSVVTCAVSVACLIGAGSVHTKRAAALATAYQLSETALTEYKNKVVETIGEKKERSINESIDKDHVDNHPVTKNEVIMTGKGKSLCYDRLSDRYFDSDIDFIKRAENELNARMINDITGYVSLNEFYDELNLKHLVDNVGDDIGWNVEKRIKIRFGSQIADDGRPCIVICHENPPFYEYDR